uniref:Phosphoglycerate mutase n=1 Tax=Panagrolaimus sp. PS1159 TaxID=55785 RepID=A0AC35ET12_9BILA
MARTIYIIRHAERMDDVDKNWMKKLEMNINLIIHRILLKDINNLLSLQNGIEKHPLIDETYDPVVNPWKEGFKGEDHDAYTDRTKDAIERILNKYEVEYKNHLTSVIASENIYSAYIFYGHGFSH